MTTVKVALCRKENKVRRVSHIEDADLEILHRILAGNDRDAHNEWRQLSADWRKHIWKLYDALYLGDTSIQSLTYF